MSINLEPTFLLKALWVRDYILKNLDLQRHHLKRIKTVLITTIYEVYTRGFAAFLEFHFSESCCALFKYLQLSFNVFSSTLIPTCEGKL